MLLRPNPALPFLWMVRALDTAAEESSSLLSEESELDEGRGKPRCSGSGEAEDGTTRWTGSKVLPVLAKLRETTSAKVQSHGLALL